MAVDCVDCADERRRKRRASPTRLRPVRSRQRLAPTSVEPTAPAEPATLWYGEGYSRGQVFLLHRRSESLRREAVCRLARHEQGWELRLDVEGSSRRLRVCGTQLEVLSVAATWKAALIAGGWH